SERPPSPSVCLTRASNQTETRKTMRHVLLASVAVLMLGPTFPAFAQDNGDADANAAVGGVAGGAGGAALGFIVGGPIGAATGVAASTVEYAGLHPVEPVYLDSVDVGFVVPPDV